MPDQRFANSFHAMLRLPLAFLLFVMLAPAAIAQTPVVVEIGYLHPERRTLTLSLLDRPTDDLGLAGAALAIEDNNTTGRFTNQSFKLTERRVTDAATAIAAASEMAAAGTRFIIADLPGDELLAVADAAAPSGVTVFNAGAPDDRLRQEDCRANVIHLAPSRTMLADALGQYLVWKQWNRWFLIVGSHPEDEAYAAAVRRAAARFGATIVEERVYTDNGGARTTDSGHVQIQRQLPVFTQGAAEHDVVVVADENEVFGGYLPYHTWDARPVAGTAGLVPTVWSPAHEAWGAVQLQNRFVAIAHRGMRSEDMLAWMGVRAVGEAATRAGATDPQAIAAYLKGPSFQLAAFKGEALTLRDWNLEMRQPILLTDGKTVVSVSPQEGFLHPTSFLDTLGYDRPETSCDLSH